MYIQYNVNKMHYVLGDMNAVAVLMQMDAVISWIQSGDKYKIGLDLKKCGPFRRVIRAICYGHHTHRRIEYCNGTIVLYRMPSWDDSCTQVPSWDNTCTSPK